MTKMKVLSLAVAALTWAGLPHDAYAACAFANGAKTGTMNFALPALTQSLNPSDTGPRLLASVTVPAATLASAMGGSTTETLWEGCTNNIIWSPQLSSIAASSPNRSGYMATGIDNLYLYMYAGNQTTGNIDGMVTPSTSGSAWSSNSGSASTLSAIGNIVLALYQTGPIRKGGTIDAGSLAELKLADGLMLMNMTMSAVTVNVLACNITTPTVNVQMPSFYRSSFTAVGNTTPATDFKIGANCDSGVIPTITFSSQGSGAATDTFAINSGSGAASGLGIQLLYSGAPVNQNEAVTMNTTTATGVTEFPFSARYIQTASDVTSGNADATITFTLQYK